MAQNNLDSPPSPPPPPPLQFPKEGQLLFHKDLLVPNYHIHFPMGFGANALITIIGQKPIPDITRGNLWSESIVFQNINIDNWLKRLPLRWMFANVTSSTPKHNAFPSVHVPLLDLPPFSIARYLALLGWWWKSVFQLLLLEKIARNLIILKPSSDDISYVCFEQNVLKRWNLSQSGTYTRLPRPPPDFKPTTIDFSNNSVRSPSWWSSHWLIYNCEVRHFYILQAMFCQDIWIIIMIAACGGGY